MSFEVAVYGRKDAIIPAGTLAAAMAQRGMPVDLLPGSVRVGGGLDAATGQWTHVIVQPKGVEPGKAPVSLAAQLYDKDDVADLLRSYEGTYTEAQRSQLEQVRVRYRVATKAADERLARELVDVLSELSDGPIIDQQTNRVTDRVGYRGAGDQDRRT